MSNQSSAGYSQADPSPGPTVSPAMQQVPQTPSLGNTNTAAVVATAPPPPPPHYEQEYKTNSPQCTTPTQSTSQGFSSPFRYCVYLIITCIT